MNFCPIYNKKKSKSTVLSGRNFRDAGGDKFIRNFSLNIPTRPGTTSACREQYKDEHWWRPSPRHEVAAMSCAAFQSDALPGPAGIRDNVDTRHAQAQTKTSKLCQIE